MTCSLASTVNELERRQPISEAATDRGVGMTQCYLRPTLAARLVKADSITPILESLDRRLYLTIRLANAIALSKRDCANSTSTCRPIRWRTWSRCWPEIKRRSNGVTRVRFVVVIRKAVRSVPFSHLATWASRESKPIMDDVI